MRYRTKGDISAAKISFSRGGAEKGAPSGKAPLSAALDNPYYRCYGAARSRGDLIQHKNNKSERG